MKGNQKNEVSDQQRRVTCCSVSFYQQLSHEQQPKRWKQRVARYPISVVLCQNSKLRCTPVSGNLSFTDSATGVHLHGAVKTWVIWANPEARTEGSAAEIKVFWKIVLGGVGSFCRTILMYTLWQSLCPFNVYRSKLCVWVQFLHHLCWFQATSTWWYYYWCFQILYLMHIRS